MNRLLSKMEVNHPFRSAIETLNLKIVSIVKTVRLKWFDKVQINSKMLEIDAYNDVAALCKRIDPFPTNILQLGRRIVRKVECRVEVNGKPKKEIELVVMNDLFIVAQVSESSVLNE